MSSSNSSNSSSSSSSGSSGSSGTINVLQSEKAVITIETVNTISKGDKVHYLQYVFKLQNRTRSWRIRRRYSDFRTLHLQLASEIKGFTLVLPPKALLSSPIDFLDDRRVRLHKYCQELADQYAADNEAVLRFLGFVPPGAVERELICINDITLGTGLAVGDILLFRCRNTAAALQRAATGAEFDHVGIIMPLAVREKVLIRMLKRQSSYKPAVAGVKRDLELVLLESTIVGVSVHPVANHLRAFDYFDSAEYICVRKLVFQRGEGSEHVDKAMSFLPTVLGKEYRFNIKDIFRFLRNSSGKIKNESSTTMTRDSGAHDSYFCSEIVAAAMKRMGLMKSEVKEHRIYPGDFSGVSLESLLCDGISYSKERTIDFRAVPQGGPEEEMRVPDATFAPSLI